MGELRNAYRPVARPRTKWNDYIENNFNEFGNGGVRHFVQDTFSLAFLLNTVLELQVS